MASQTLTTGDRAAAAMIGMAVGAQLGIDPVRDADAPFGVRLAPTLPESPWPAAAAVGIEAARAFGGGAPDLKAFAMALGDWDARDGRGASSGLRTALRELHLRFAPIRESHGAIGEPLLAAIPIGIVARHSARNMASASTHATALLAPHPLVQQAAIALAAAAAHLVSGHTDFIPEVIDALKADGAPAELLAIPRRVPLTRREHLEALLADAPPALAVLEAALWCADREPVAGRGAAMLAAMALPAEVRSAACSAALALMALRDGAGCVPALWSGSMAHRALLEEVGAVFA